MDRQEQHAIAADDRAAATDERKHDLAVKTMEAKAKNASKSKVKEPA